MGDERTVTLRVAAEDAFSATMEKAVQSFALLGKEALADIANIQKAFRDLNLKSALDIDVEKAKLLDAFNQIKVSGVASADDIKRAQVAYHAEMDKLDQQLKVVRKSTDEVAEAEKKHASSSLSLTEIVKGLAVSFGALSLADLIRQSVDAAVKMQALEVQFKTISGSSALAAENLKYVREESGRLGLVFTDTAQAFAKFSASAKGSALEGEGVRKVFSAVTETVTALHLPADSAQRIFDQLSQMMSKGKVTAEDLNVVAESMPGTFQALASAMGLTTAELRSQMEQGKVMASEVLPKLADQLHATYGGAAAEGAKSAQAEFNRFKNSVFETSAAFGQTLMPVLTLGINLVTGFGDAIKWVINTLGPAAPVATAFAIAIGVISAAYKLLTAEVIASTAAFLTNPVFLLIAAGTAAVLAVAAAFNEIAKAIGLTGAASEKSAEAQAAALKAAEEKAAKEKKILDDYEKAVGITLDRQLAKEKQTYDESVKAVEAKWDADIKAAGNNAEKVKQLEAAKAKDLEELYHGHLTKRQELREKDAEAERKYYADSLQTGINYYKAIGEQTGAEVNDYKLKLTRKIEAVEKYYALELEKAQGNVVAVLAIEQAKEQQIADLKKKAADDHVLIGLDRQKRELDNEKQATDAQILEIKRKVAQHVTSEQEGQEQILALEKANAQKIYENRLAYAEQTKKSYGAQSDEYKAALKDQETAYAAYLGKSIEQTKSAESARKLEWDINSAAYKNVLDKELANIQEFCQNGTLSVKEAAVQRLQAETDYFEKVKKLRAEQLAALNPETQTLEYQKAVNAKLAADQQYTKSYNDLLAAQEKLDADNQAKITARHKEEIDKRVAAEKAAQEQQRAFASSWFALWDKAYNDGAASLSKLSDAAYNMFASTNKLPMKITESVASLKESAAKTEEELIAMGKAADQAALTSANGFGRAYHDLQMISAGAKEITLEFTNQKIAALTLADGLSKLKGATPGVISAAEQSIEQFKLLDNSTLDKIKSQIERLKGIVESFRESIRSTVSSLQDELDNLTLNKAQLETKRYEKQLDDLNAKLKQATALNDTESQRQLQEAIENAKKIHDIKMKNIADEAAAAKAAADASKPSTDPNKKQGFARGGRFPGNSLFDNIQVWARSGEWFVQNEAADVWGDDFMANVINNPWSEAGRAVQERLAGFSAPVMPVINRPQVAFSGGGKVSTAEPAERQVMRVQLMGPSGKSVKGDFSQSDARSFLDILQEAGLRTA